MQRTDTAGYKIRLIHNQVHKDMEAKRLANEESFALTSMQRWTVGYLKEHENEAVYQRDIEAEFQVSRATASNMLSVMERKGLLERRAVEHDARLKQLVLTAQGRAIIERVNADIEEMEERLLRGFSAEEVQQLLGMLNRMLQNLGADAKAAEKCCEAEGNSSK